jgi:CheY-like chemotaxis protein
VNILIVDDSAANRKLLRLQLEAEGHILVEAADGVEALAVLEAGPVDAIIADVLMPNMDGFALCRSLRQHGRFSAVPYIVYTSTYNSPGDEKMAYLVGADKYLTKPAPVAVMLQALREVTSGELCHGPGRVAPADNLVVMQHYNSVLVRKLEERNGDLERAQAELLRAHFKLQQQTEELARLNEGLEQRVAERTAELEKQKRELVQTLAEVKRLSGLLPICCYCKRIRNDQNYWQSVENYISEHASVTFSHGYCPDCVAKYVQPQLDKLETDSAAEAGP